MNREALEKQALSEVCSCYYYDLADSIDALDDETINNIINIPWYCHIEQQLKVPQSSEDFMAELRECAEFIK